MTKITILADEITNDPLSVGYSGFTDQQIVDSMNGLTRPILATIDSILDDMRTNKNRTNTGSNPGDLVSDFVYGRLELVADGSAGSSPFDASNAFSLTQKMIVSAKTMLNILNIQNQSNEININFDEILTDLVDAGVLGTVDRTRILALTDNQQSRGNELGIGRVSLGNVAEATE